MNHNIDQQQPVMPPNDHIHEALSHSHAESLGRPDSEPGASTSVNKNSRKSGSQKKGFMKRLSAVFRRSVSRGARDKQENDRLSPSRRSAITTTSKEPQDEVFEVPVPYITAVEDDQPISPYEYMVHEIHERGHSSELVRSIDIGFLDASEYQESNPSTETQQQHLLEAIREDNVEKLGELLDNGYPAIFPSSNIPGDHSVLHYMCRRGQAACLRKFFERGASVQISEGYGLTALHAACSWSIKPNFEVVELLLQQDRRLLFVTDDRGSSPLEFTRKSHDRTWKQFVDSKLDTFWPRQVVQAMESEDHNVAVATSAALTVQDGIVTA